MSDAPQPLICAMCGAEVREEDAHCPQCGAPLRDDPAELAAAEKKLAEVQSARPQPVGLFADTMLHVGLILSILFALGAVIGTYFLVTEYGCLGLLIGGAAFLYHAAIATVFSVLIGLRKKAAPSPPPWEERP